MRQLENMGQNCGKANNWSPREKREKEREKKENFEKITIEKFPSLMKTTDSQIQAF